MSEEKLKPLEAGTRIRVHSTFGQKWLEAEYGDMYGKFYCIVKERTEPGVYAVSPENSPEECLLVRRSEVEVINGEDEK